MKFDNNLGIVMAMSLAVLIALIQFTGFSFVLIDSTETFPLEKMVGDWDFIREHYSEERALWFVKFYLNALIVSHIVLVVFVVFRVTFARKVEVNIGKKEIVFSKRLVAAGLFCIMLSYVVFLMPSFFKLPGEISTFRYGPNLKAIFINYVYFFAYIGALSNFLTQVFVAFNILKSA